MTTAATHPAVRTATIRPPSRRVPLDLRELWEFRELLLSLAIRDVKVRYKQTALGAVWVVLQPLIGAMIFTFVFGKMAQFPSDGIPYLPFAFAGMLGWSAFSTTLQHASNTLVQNSVMISKIYFPRLILPLSTVFSTLIDLCVGFVVMVILLFAYQINPGWQILLLPVWLTMLYMFCLGIGIFFASLMVSYRDVRYVLPVLTQFLMYLSPVAYGLSAVEEKVPAWLVEIYVLNPLASLFEAVRWSILGVGDLTLPHLTYSAVLSIGTFALSLYAFKRMERKFADVI